MKSLTPTELKEKIDNRKIYCRYVDWCIHRMLGPIVENVSKQLL